MSMLWIISFLLLCGQSVAEDEERDEKEMFNNEPLERYQPNDFRCFQFAFDRFAFTNDIYNSLNYFADPAVGRQVGCATGADGRNLIYYPHLTALDPMMAFYIHQIYEWIPFVTTTQVVLFGTKTENTKQYCMDIRLIGSTFPDYVNTFHSDKETCRELKEIAIECFIFRHLWVVWVRQLYELFCLDEDGCYNIMELYDEDMPHCVKYIARSQFQNATFGSWHHSILNYCELTDMVPQAKDANYDRLTLSEDGKTDDEIQTMCQFLRFRLLPEEGNEEEIREITLKDAVVDTDKDGDKDSSACYPELLYVTLAVYVYQVNQ